MKLKMFLILLVSLLGVRSSFAQQGDAVLGMWQSEHGSARIQVFKSGESYNGKIVWLKESSDESGKPKTDINNPSEELRSRPIIGLEVLTDFTYKADNLWDGGKVYDPRSGKKYSCRLSISGTGDLEVRAFMGISLVGKTQVWSRVK